METKRPLPSLQDLLGLLDAQTLATLAERLHRVAHEEQEPPEQLLLAFIDETLDAYDEADLDGVGQASLRREQAAAVLDSIS